MSATEALPGGASAGTHKAPTGGREEGVYSVRTSPATSCKIEHLADSMGAKNLKTMPKCDMQRKRAGSSHQRGCEDFEGCFDHQPGSFRPMETLLASAGSCLLAAQGTFARCFPYIYNAYVR